MGPFDPWSLQVLPDARMGYRTIGAHIGYPGPCRCSRRCWPAPRMCHALHGHGGDEDRECHVDACVQLTVPGEFGVKHKTCQDYGPCLGGLASTCAHYPNLLTASPYQGCMWTWIHMTHSSGSWEVASGERRTSHSLEVWSLPHSHP